MDKYDVILNVDDNKFIEIAKENNIDIYKYYGKNEEECFRSHKTFVLGRMATKIFFVKNNINFNNIPDLYKYDKGYFVYNNKTITTRSRSKPHYIRTLEKVSEFNKMVKDIYISTLVNDYDNDSNIYHCRMLNWVKGEDFKNRGRVENQGYGNNYVIYDNKSRTINSLLELLRDPVDRKGFAIFLKN
jgi:hypothetical protein